MRRCACILACVLLAVGIFLTVVNEREQPPAVVQTPVLMVILDDSYSMTASCGSTSRLAVAQAFIRRIAVACDDADVALITFSGDAMLDVPPTADKEAFLTALAEIEPSFSASQGSNPAAGLALAETVAYDRPAIAILLTDGEEHHASSTALTAVSERTLPLAWCVIGDEAPIPMPLGTSWLRDSDTHEIALTRACPEAVAAFAEASAAPQLRITADDDSHHILQFMEQTVRTPQKTHSTNSVQYKLAVCATSLGSVAMMLLWLGCSRMLMVSTLVMLMTASLFAEMPHELVNAAVDHVQKAQVAAEPTMVLEQLRQARLLVAEALRNSPDCAAAQHNLRVIVLLEQQWRKQEPATEVASQQEIAQTDEALPLAGEPGPASQQNIPETARSAGAVLPSAASSEAKPSLSQPADVPSGTAPAGSWRQILKREQSLKQRPAGVKPW